MKPFAKHTFTLPLLLRSLGVFLLNLPLLLLAYLRPATSRALRCKVMLAVASVHDCRACSWAHTGLALANGVDPDELNQLQQLLGSGKFGAMNEREATAILFAQHYADTQRRPSLEARASLARHFGAYQRAEIMAYIHSVYYTSLTANSADAWLARLKGRKSAHGHPVAEAIATLIASPLLLIAAFASRFLRPELMRPLDAD